MDSAAPSGRSQPDPFVTVVNISQSQLAPAPQAFYQNPQYHSVLEGRKLSVQVPNESSEEGVTFVTVLDVRDGGEEGSPSAPGTERVAVTTDSFTDLAVSPVSDKAAGMDVKHTKLAADETPSAVVSSHTTELVTLYRLPGERLGLGLKFRGGESAEEAVQGVSVQSCAEGSPSARASCSWGRLQPGDRITAIAGRPVTALTRLQCVQLLQDTPLAVELRVRHLGRRETLVSQDSGISLGGDTLRVSPAREVGARDKSPTGRRERRAAAAPAAPLVATDALSAQEAWLQTALESDGSSCSSRSSTSTVVERGAGRLPPPPAPQLDLASALRQFERLERELSMDSVFATGGGDEEGSVSPLPPPEVFQDRPKLAEDSEIEDEEERNETRTISREPSSPAEEDEGFHDSGGSGGASPPASHRRLSDGSGEEGEAQTDDCPLEDGTLETEEITQSDEEQESPPGERVTLSKMSIMTEPDREGSEEESGARVERLSTSACDVSDEDDESNQETTEKADEICTDETEAAEQTDTAVEVATDSPDSSAIVLKETESPVQSDQSSPETAVSPETAESTDESATDAALSDEGPSEGVLANYVPTPMPRKRAMVLVPAESDDDSVEGDSGATADTETPAATPVEPKHNQPGPKYDQGSMSFEVSSSVERRRKASAQDELSPLGGRHWSGGGDTDPERPASSEDSDWERPRGAPSAGRCRDSSPESPPPPSGARQPPDGHEFPPDFAERRPSSATPSTTPALLRPPSRYSDRGASPTAEKADSPSVAENSRGLSTATRGRNHRSGSLGGATSRIGESELSSSLLRRATARERQSMDDLQRTGGRSLLGGRSPRGQTSVKDKIALFSSQSVEQLSQPHPKLLKHKSLENDLPTRGPLRSQARSKSDLKLSETESARSRPGDVLARRKRIAEGRGPRFGSMLNMHLGERRESDSRVPSGDTKPGDRFKPNDESPVTPQRSRPPLGQRPLRGASECGTLSSLHSDSVTSLSERPSRYREVSPGPLSERSQSLLDLGQPEKRHSFAGLQEREFSYSGHSSSLTRKVSLNSITEERKRSLSRLRGLVIPDKVDGLAKKGPVDLPTIKSKALSSLSSSSFRVSGTASAAVSPRPTATPRSEKVDHQLSSPPWKSESPNMQKYSPAFKRKNISVLSSSGSSGSAFHLVSTSSQLGGSSVELSRPSRRDLARTSPLPRDPRSADRRSEPRTTRPRLADSSEPLQRSSSLNSRPLSALGQLRRKISDDDAADLRSRLEPADSDCGGSTLTLVNEPADSEEPELAGRGRAGSLEFDHRASTSTLHGSPVKELDVEEELLRAAERFHSRSGDAEQQARLSAAAGSPSPPRLLDDDAWRKFAGERRPSAPPPGCETRDLAKLRQVTKVTSLKQKWQQLNADSQGTETTSPRTASTRSEDVAESPASSVRSPPSSISPLPSSLSIPSSVDTSETTEVSSSSVDVTDSPAEVTTSSLNDITDSPLDVTDAPADVSSPALDSEWPSLQDRSGLDRKLSTPSYSSPDLQLREKKDSVPSRPHSWMESERELGGYLRSPSVASSQENIMDSLESAKSPSGSTSSLLEMLTANLKSTARSRHALSVSDLRRAFERWDGRPHSGNSGHTRMSSLDSSASEDGHLTGGSTASPTTARDHYGSITSLASSTSLISPHELQQLIDEANQSLEESGTPSHEIIVAVIHREMMGGSIGVTLAGGADYENKEISVNKVITGSVADRDGRIKKGDRVISINGRSSKGMSHREALNTLKAPRAEVVLVLSRSRSVTPHDPNSEDQRPSISTMYSRPPKILESPMDSKSLASELAQEDEFRGPPVTISLKKEGAGLGFSLQGGKDSPLGDRPLVAKKIFTGGAADKSGLLHVRDQILAINDQDITHMARIEAWNLLKKQPDGLVRLTIRKWLPNGPVSGADAATQPPAGPAADVPTSPESTQEARPAPATGVARPTALPAAGRADTRPVIAGVTPKAAPLGTPAVVLPQA
ncbi:serine/arginine repetitive matrix protein 2-like [Amphibalanus amphitrite]|uniref:serine/arginine repetitive matrix protein 2-like n=1 Tax=Amphibalanus amphitrite TaxID=1232801 RepID=UPI001C906768|nr:serine/arginine repetitive matrix protein 2-like [Amphibalanus amphitrite]